MIWTVKNGKKQLCYPNTVLVTGESQLSELTGFEPGSIAFTAGYANMWQLDPDGTWQVIVQEGGT